MTLYYKTTPGLVRRRGDTKITRSDKAQHQQDIKNALCLSIYVHCHSVKHVIVACIHGQDVSISANIDLC